MIPLRFAITSPPSGCEEDLHLQAIEHARHTNTGTPRLRGVQRLRLTDTVRRKLTKKQTGNRRSRTLLYFVPLRILKVKRAEDDGEYGGQRVELRVRY